MSSTVYALSIHSDYRCRHSGACCSTDWDVPVELPVYRSLSAAVAAGRLRVSAAAGSLEPFILEPDLPPDSAAILERTERGACVFFDGPSRLCIVHRDCGEAALPATCRHFPRLAVRDGRGTFITLSHFCPTAAGMLFRDDVPVRVIESPPAFPAADYEGLVVTADDLPPLLHPRMLMDADGYSAWERHMVSRCADVTRTPESVLATLASDAARLREWSPGGPSLSDAVARLPAAWITEGPPATLVASRGAHADAMRAVPDDLRPEPDEWGLDEAYEEHVKGRWSDFRAPLDRYLAGKAFASWTAYQGRGIATIVRGLEAALHIVRIEAARQCRDAGRPLDAALLLEAFRSADFILNHLAVGEDLADTWGEAEN